MTSLICNPIVKLNSGQAPRKNHPGLVTYNEPSFRSLDTRDVASRPYGPMIESCKTGRPLMWRDILKMFGHYILQEDAIQQIVQSVPSLDAMYPFVWSSSTLQAVAEELEIFSIEASCILPGGFIATMFAPDIFHVTFNIINNGELALNVELCSALGETVDTPFEDWRLGLMSFKTGSNAGSNAIGVERGCVSSLGMWSARRKRNGGCYFDSIELRDLYRTIDVEVDWDEDVGPLWHLFDEHGEITIIDLHKVEEESKYIHAIFQSSWYRIEQRSRYMAFAMGLHERLGKDSWVYFLEPEHLREILE